MDQLIDTSQIWRVQIACDLRDEEGAREWLERLRIVDSSPFYYQRVSRVESTFGSAEAAYQLASRAVKGRRYPPFAFLSQIATTSIRVGRLDEAEEWLAEMKSRFPRSHLDVQAGLRCEILIARGKYDEALEAWAEIGDQTKPVHAALRRKALLGKLNDLPAWSPGRQNLEKEVAKLAEYLDGGEVDLGRMVDEGPEPVEQDNTQIDGTDPA